MPNSGLNLFAVPDESIVHYFNSSKGLDARYTFKEFADGKPSLQIFCREGDPKALIYYFRSAKVTTEAC